MVVLSHAIVSFNFLRRLTPMILIPRKQFMIQLIFGLINKATECLVDLPAKTSMFCHNINDISVSDSTVKKEMDTDRENTNDSRGTSV